MRCLIALIFSITGAFAQDTAKRRSPDRLGPFVIGQSYTKDFDSTAEALGLNTKLLGYTHVSSLNDLLLYQVEPGQTEIYSLPTAYELIDDFSDTSELWNSYVPPNSYMRVFFIPTLQIEDVVVNNVVLKYWYAKLYSIEYNSSLELGQVIVDNYRGMGAKSTKSFTTSPCKYLFKGKRYRNNSTSILFIDDHREVASTLTLNAGLDASCKAFSYISVIIIKLGITTDYKLAIKENVQAKKLAIIEAAKAKKERKAKAF